MPPIGPFVKVKGHKDTQIDTHFSLFVSLGMHIASFWGSKDNQLLSYFMKLHPGYFRNRMKRSKERHMLLYGVVAIYFIG